MIERNIHFSEPVTTKGNPSLMDTRFKVNLVSQTPNPQKLMYSCMHQCYSEDLVSETETTLSETRCGEIAVQRLLKGDRGHFNPLEAPQMTLSVGYFPHSVMQQLRTHRIGVSFSVQSFRYTGERILELGVLGEMSKTSAKVNFNELFNSIENIFYIRPVGDYTDREGKRYTVTQEQREEDLYHCLESSMLYRKRLNLGYSEEHARSIIPLDVRQHFNFTGNVRSILHVLDLRAKKDAQLECQQFCELVVPHIKSWVPEIWNWYETNRYQKARLAP